MSRSHFSSLFVAFAAIIASAAAADIRFDRVGQWGGTCNAVTIRDNLAYVGIGPRIVVLDITDPDHPTSVSESEPLGGRVLDIAIEGQFAFLAVSQVGLRIVDVGDAAHPTALPNSLAPTQANRVAVGGNIACVTSYWNGFRLFDVSNPHRPVELFRFEPNSWSGGDAKIVDGYLYYSGSSRLRIFDLATPQSPTIVGELLDFRSQSIAVRNGWLVAPTDWGDFVVVDVTAASEPRIHETLLLEPIPLDPRVEWIGNRAFVLDSTGTLITLDLTDVQAPRLLRSLELEEYVQFGAIAVQGELAWITKPFVGVTSYQIGADSTFSERGSFTEAGSVFEARIFGGNAFVIGHSGCVHRLDVSDPQRPRYCDSFGSGAQAIEFDGLYAFLGQHDGLAIFELAPGHSPREVARAELQAPVTDLALHEHALYVAYSSGNLPWQGELAVLDVTNQADPEWTDWSLWVPGVTLKIRDNRLLMLSSWLSTFNVFDLTTPEAPSGVAFFPTRGPGLDVEVTADRAYVLSNYGIDVLDISDLARIQPGSFVRHSGADRIATNGSHLFLGGALSAFELTDPDLPHLAGEYVPMQYASSIEVVDQLLYVGSVDDGLEIIAVSRRGDLNGDDRISLEDLAGVLAAFGTCAVDPTFNRLADLDQDGCVELFDLAALLVAME